MSELSTVFFSSGRWFGNSQLPSKSNALVIQKNWPYDNWVKCSECRKWRKMPAGWTAWPGKFLCSMNSWNEEYSACHLAEEPYRYMQRKPRTNQSQHADTATCSSSAESGVFVKPDSKSELHTFKTQAHAPTCGSYLLHCSSGDGGDGLLFLFLFFFLFLSVFVFVFVFVFDFGFLQKKKPQREERST
jgi:hypothetical protein